MFLTDPTLFFNANTDASAAKELINTNIGLLDGMLAESKDVGAIKTALEACNIDALTDKIDTTKEDLIKLDDNFATQYMTLIQETLNNSTFDTENMSNEELATYNSLVRDYDTTLLTMLEKYESEGLLTDEMQQQLDYQRAKVARYDITDQMAVLSPSSEGYLALYEKCAECDRKMIKYDPNLTEEERTTALNNYEENYNTTYSKYKELRENRVKYETGMAELEQLEKEKDENNGWFHPILENEYKEKILDKKIELGIATDDEKAYKNMNDWDRFWTDTGTFCTSFINGWGKLGENIIDATVTTVGAMGGGSKSCSDFVALDLTDMGYKGFVDATGMNTYSAYSEVHDAGFFTGKLSTKVALSFTAPWFNAVVSGVSAMGERAEEGFQNGEGYYEAFGHSLVSGVVGAAEGYANSKMNMNIRKAFSDGTVKNALTSVKNFFTGGAKEGVKLSAKETLKVAGRSLKPSLKNALKSTVMDADIWVDTGSVIFDDVITGVSTGNWNVGQMLTDAGTAAFTDFGSEFTLGYTKNFMSGKKSLKTILSNSDELLNLSDFDDASIDEVFSGYTNKGAKVKYVQNDGKTFAVVMKDDTVLNAFNATGYKPKTSGSSSSLQILDGGGEKRLLSGGNSGGSGFERHTATRNSGSIDTDASSTRRATQNVSDSGSSGTRNTSSSSGSTSTTKTKTTYVDSPSTYSTSGTSRYHYDYDSSPSTRTSSVDTGGSARRATSVSDTSTTQLRRATSDVTHTTVDTTPTRKVVADADSGSVSRRVDTTKTHTSVDTTPTRKAVADVDSGSAARKVDTDVTSTTRRTTDIDSGTTKKKSTSEISSKVKGKKDIVSTGATSITDEIEAAISDSTTPKKKATADVSSTSKKKKSSDITTTKKKGATDVSTSTKPKSDIITKGSIDFKEEVNKKIRSAVELNSDLGTVASNYEKKIDQQVNEWTARIIEEDISNSHWDGSKKHINEYINQNGYKFDDDFKRKLYNDCIDTDTATVDYDKLAKHISDHEGIDYKQVRNSINDFSTSNPLTFNDRNLVTLGIKTGEEVKARVTKQIEDILNPDAYLDEFTTNASKKSIREKLGFTDATTFDEIVGSSHYKTYVDDVVGKKRYNQVVDEFFPDGSGTSKVYAFQPQWAFDEYTVKGRTLGRNEGYYVISEKQLKDALSEASGGRKFSSSDIDAFMRGDVSFDFDRKKFADALGFEDDYFKNGAVLTEAHVTKGDVRSSLAIDVGANSRYTPGMNTSGGSNELVARQVSDLDLNASEVNGNKVWNDSDKNVRARSIGSSGGKAAAATTVDTSTIGFDSGSMGGAKAKPDGGSVGGTKPKANVTSTGVARPKTDIGSIDGIKSKPDVTTKTVINSVDTSTSKAISGSGSGTKPKADVSLTDSVTSGKSSVSDRVTSTIKPASTVTPSKASLKYSSQIDEVVDDWTVRIIEDDISNSHWNGSKKHIDDYLKQNGYKFDDSYKKTLYNDCIDTKSGTVDYDKLADSIAKHEGISYSKVRSDVYDYSVSNRLVFDDDRIITMGIKTGEAVKARVTKQIGEVVDPEAYLNEFKTNSSKRATRESLGFTSKTSFDDIVDSTHYKNYVNDVVGETRYNQVVDEFFPGGADTSRVYAFQPQWAFDEYTVKGHTLGRNEGYYVISEKQLKDALSDASGGRKFSSSDIDAFMKGEATFDFDRKKFADALGFEADYFDKGVVLTEAPVSKSDVRASLAIDEGANSRYTPGMNTSGGSNEMLARQVNDLEFGQYTNAQQKNGAWIDPKKNVRAREIKALKEPKVSTSAVGDSVASASSGSTGVSKPKTDVTTKVDTMADVSNAEEWRRALSERYGSENVEYVSGAIDYDAKVRKEYDDFTPIETRRNAAVEYFESLKGVPWSDGGLGNISDRGFYTKLARADDMSYFLESEGILSREKFYEVWGTPRGKRPDPSEYLSADYIAKHTDEFIRGGASRLVDGDVYTKWVAATGNVGNPTSYVYSPGGAEYPDGCEFMSTHASVDTVLTNADNATKNHPTVANSYEKSIVSDYGLTDDAVGKFANFGIRRYDIDGDRLRGLRIRMASGNEPSAYVMDWIPGGYTSGRHPEMTIDRFNIRHPGKKVIKIK